MLGGNPKGRLCWVKVFRARLCVKHTGLLEFIFINFRSHGFEHRALEPQLLSYLNCRVVLVELLFRLQSGESR